ncbi:hypothetical protein GCM10027321_02300 [Massilia terrae]|uniref:DUF4936 family protein n=1 Tax=Massilia terrae TaxID=1811224 RepID=A0ABT2CTV4_9BURK|nr:DUF4936 family protein [Massilia terrae]MCS0657406.1 DUF4936 family protein [Massilia terrae]
MTDLYVYYKVPVAHAARLEALVRAMQAGLAVSHAVAPQLKRRPDARDGVQTWMEVYPAVSDSFAEALAHAEREAGLADLIAGPRHAEVFMDLTTCA